MTSGQGSRGAHAAAGAPLARALEARDAAAPLADAAGQAAAPAVCPKVLHVSMIGNMTTNKGEEIRAALRANAETIATAERERGELIASARRAGVEWAAICADTGQSRMTVNRIAIRANNDKLPKPGDPAPRKRRRAS